MKVSSLIEKLQFAGFRLLPIQKKTVLFQSFSGQYGDNPKYVSEELHRLRPGYKIIWVSSKESNGTDFPTYAKVVERGTLLHSYYAATSQAAVDNMSGLRAFRQKDFKHWRRFFLTRKGQLNLCTWHGTPLKKIGIHEAAPGIKVYQTSAKSMTTGNEYCFQIFKECFPGIPIVKSGNPRNDVFFMEKPQKDWKQELGLPADKKVLLYGPTFRNSVYESGLHQLEEAEPEKLLRAFQEKFGGEWVLCIRLHHEVMNALRESFQGFVDNVKVFDGNAHDDMAAYLAASDALLTDYSSSFFDYALTDRPVFLYGFDRKSYTEQERGLYRPLESLPFTFADSFKELLQNVAAYDAETALSDRSAFLQDIGSFEDGKASERLANEIIEFSEKGH